ncbi:MAG: cysteine desulfurase family protein [Myxococcota bacterium]
MNDVYLDYNATAPLRPEALRAMNDVLAHTHGNPSSTHAFGAAARAALARARKQVADALGVTADSIVFTSGATEANNTVLRQVARTLAGRDVHLVSCATEHPSVLEELRALGAEGCRVTILPVERDGRLDVSRFEAALGPSTRLASVMWANNETGVIQPIAELARAAAARGVPFHSDGVQALGKLPLALAALPVDYASFSAHKLGGPKGVGALYVRPGVELVPLLRGGSQEKGRRPGTENVPGIVGFGAACEAAGAEFEHAHARHDRLRERLWDGIRAALPDALRNGAREHTLAHTLNVSFPGASGEALVEALDLEGVAVATGAACHAGSTEPSHVLSAMGLARELGASAIRFSLGSGVDDAALARVLEVLPRVVTRVRQARAA